MKDELFNKLKGILQEDMLKEVFQKESFQGEKVDRKSLYENYQKILCDRKYTVSKGRE